MGHQIGPTIAILFRHGSGAVCLTLGDDAPIFETRNVMKKLSALLLSGGALLFAACGDVKIEADPIGEVDFTESRSAFFVVDSASADVDLDGTIDDQATNLLVVLANDPELCTKLEADPNALNAEADSRLVSIALSKFDIDGVDGILEGDVLSTTAETDANGARIDSSTFALTFSQRVNGETPVSAFIDSAETDTVTINKFDAEAGVLELELSATLTESLIAGAAGELSAPVSIQVRSASLCDALSGAF
jgi:hypothetical protein